MNLTDKIAELRELAERATPGPWDNRCNSFSNSAKPRFIWTGHGFNAEVFGASFMEDAEFIAASRTLVPALLDALEAALGALDWIEFRSDKSLHTEHSPGFYGTMASHDQVAKRAREARAEMAKILQVSG